MAITRSAPSSERALDGELADRPAAPDRHHVAALGCRHRSAACQPVGRMSERKSTCSSLDAVRHLERPDVGERHAHVLGLTAGDIRRAGASSRRSRRRCAAERLGDARRSGWSCRSSEDSSLLTVPARPHAMGTGTTTRSPTFELAHVRPTSTTSPMNSWPSTSPAASSGRSRCRDAGPSRRWRSPSPARSRRPAGGSSGRGRSRTRILRVPCQVTARIVLRQARGVVAHVGRVPATRAPTSVDLARLDQLLEAAAGPRGSAGPAPRRRSCEIIAPTRPAGGS